MDEEKTIEESVETEEERSVETEDERTIEPAFFDDMLKDTEPVLKDAPMLRDVGDPDPADPNMIQKHLDNFLAMLCGETPIDDVNTNSQNVRGHILSTDPTPINSIEKLDNWFKSFGNIIVDLSTIGYTTIGGTTNQTIVIRKKADNTYAVVRQHSGSINAVDIGTLGTQFDTVSDAVNAIN